MTSMSVVTPAQPPTPPIHLVTRHDPWRVIVAEADLSTREALASVLADEGYDVVEARDGSELISRLQEVAREAHGREHSSSRTCACRASTASTRWRRCGAHAGIRP
jgi:hypothetical protein